LNAQGYSTLFIGFLFAVYSWAILLATPVCAALVRLFGRDTMLCVGIITLSVFSSTFGYAKELSFGSHCLMSVIYAASRILSGFGAALIYLAVFSMAADTFPEDLGKIMGINEVVIGLGFTVGPPIGSILFVSFGFGPAFLITASAVLLTLPLAITKGVLDLRLKRAGGLPEHFEAQHGEGEPGGFSRVINVKVLLGGMLCFFGTLVFGVLEPSLAEHLTSTAGLSQTAVGAIFAVLSGVYTVCGVPMGWVADTHGYFFTCAAGILFSGCTLAIMGAPVYSLLAGALNIALSDVIVVKDCVLLAALGLGQAMLLVPSLPLMKEAAGHNEAATTEAVVTLFNCFQQLGLAVGPLLGAALVSSLGYDSTLLVLGVVMVLFGLVCAWHHTVYSAIPKYQNTHSDILEEAASNDATAPLLGEPTA